MQSILRSLLLSFCNSGFPSLKLVFPQVIFLALPHLFFMFCSFCHSTTFICMKCMSSSSVCCPLGWKRKKSVVEATTFNKPQWSICLMQCFSSGVPRHRSVPRSFYRCDTKSLNIRESKLKKHFFHHCGLLCGLILDLDVQLNLLNQMSVTRDQKG